MKNVYNFFQDPGHGWLAVPLVDIKELGIEHIITGYSYQKGGTAYLEEDCDASVFFKAYEDKFGKKPEYVSKHTNGTSPIRSYGGYQTTANHDPQGYMKFMGYGG